jgi:hypothetical protein
MWSFHLQSIFCRKTNLNPNIVLHLSFDSSLSAFQQMAGGAVITIAAIIYINTEEWSEFYTRNMHRASIVCMVAGSMTILVAAFGFYAVLKNTSRLWRTVNK